MHDNNLYGTIPKELGILKFHTVLDLGMNEWTGLIPSELTNLINIKTMYGIYVTWFSNQLNLHFSLLKNYSCMLVVVKWVKKLDSAMLKCLCEPAI